MQEENKDPNVQQKYNSSSNHMAASKTVSELISQGKFINNFNNDNSGDINEPSTLFEISWGRSYACLNAALCSYVFYLQKMVDHINGSSVEIEKVDHEYPLSNICLISMLRAYVDKRRNGYFVAREAKIDFVNITIDSKVIDLQMLTDLKKEKIISKDYLSDDQFLQYLLYDFKFRVYAPTDNKNVVHPSNQDVIFYRFLLEVIKEKRVNKIPVSDINENHLLLLAKNNYINDQGLLVVSESKQLDGLGFIVPNQDHAKERESGENNPGLAP
jgi:hypothetical protein